MVLHLSRFCRTTSILYRYTFGLEMLSSQCAVFQQIIWCLFEQLWPGSPVAQIHQQLMDLMPEAAL